MSEAWGADLIPQPRGVRIDLVEALSGAKHLPAEAIEEAVRTAKRVAEPVLDVVRRAAVGATLTEREQNLLFWGIHVLAAARDVRLFRPLLALLRRPDQEVEELLGDVITATLPRVAASVFDGDEAALHGAICDPAIDEFARWSLFGALTYLTFDGRLDRASTRTFLVRFDDERLARAGDASWNGWWDAIVFLGFPDLAERIKAAIADARILPEDGDGDDLARDLAETEARPDDARRLERFDLGYLDDPVAALDNMFAAHASQDDEAEEPLRNPLRSVGRNDPCPCGSGRKFKRCCLDRAAEPPQPWAGRGQ